MDGGIEKAKRKKRADKKREIQPVVSLDLYDCFKRLSFITSRPVKTIGEHLVLESLNCPEVIDQLKAWFRRDYWWISPYEDTISIPGDPTRQPMKIDRGEEVRRITLRFSITDYDQLGHLAYALDLTPSSTVTVLLETSMRYSPILPKYLERFVREKLNNDQWLQLDKVMNILNEGYAEKMTVTMIINKIADDLLNQGGSPKHILKRFYDWLDQFD